MSRSRSASLGPALHPSLDPPWGSMHASGAKGGRIGLVLDLASAAVIAAVIAVVLLTFRDYGITWDETWHLVYGDYILEWFLTLGADTSALCYRIDFLYGGTFDLLGAIVRRVSPLSGFDTIHLFGALVGVLGLLGAWRLARRLGGPFAGFMAVTLLATTPVYYGHMFNNPKDLPFAVGYVWAIDALCEVVLHLPRVPRRVWIRFAILAGLAMGVRIAGILLLCYLGAIVAVLAWQRLRATGSLAAGLRTVQRLGRPAALAMMGAWVVMLMPWPWALLDPLRRPFMALGRMSRFTIHKRSMPFAGEEMLTTDPRWDYLLHYFGLKLPVLVLVLVLVAVGLAGAAWLRRSRVPVPHQRARAGGVLVLAIAIPPLYAIVLRSVLYDGLRHFLFLVPVLAVVASLGAVSLPRVLARRWPAAPRAVMVTLVMLALGASTMIVRQVRAMHELHPHQYVYFNEIIGGLPGAYGNYDTDYYGNSYKEGFAALAEQLWRTDPQRFLDTRYLVTGCIPDFIAREYVHGNFAWAKNASEGAQFYLGYTRADCHLRYERRPELLRVERMGTMLLTIRDLRGDPVAEDEDEGGEDDTDEDEPKTRRPRPRRLGNARRQAGPARETKRSEEADEP
ncbi:ArnT family glycosyltransferase [Paraliomyxa miuraensis]|uniref:ArnT family glycosyltransferase n=1 Tax=Paraliomyxa miuraensis TaxID=376150 RepID=UPI002251EC81|nr:glycosyltransferase family 39 protein [Paraliomyxa miuraensis]MCX4244480.1 glycosyltransferase family 39 protein [Paraliomyxa miuraensis]